MFVCSANFRDGVPHARLAAGGAQYEISKWHHRFGYPTVVSPLMPSDSAADLTSTVPLLFGSFQRGALFGSRREMEIVFDVSRYIEYRQILAQMTERFDISIFDIGTTSLPGQIVGLYPG
jgi:hypothetical protein